MQLSWSLVSYALLAAMATAVHVKLFVHHEKFREVTIIADNASCPNGGDVLLCQSESYSCQDDGTGKQKCLERDDSFLDTITNQITTPWAQCSQKNASQPSKCLFNFECNCMDYTNDDCYCMPPDAWRTKRTTAENCTTSGGDVGTCDKGKYCRSKDSYQECATAPYLPNSTALYSDCTSDGICDSGLTCKKYDNFGLCIKGSSGNTAQN